MSSFEKAVRRLKIEIARHDGHKPEEVSVTRYPDAATFARFWPGEDFAAHRVNRAAFIKWLKAEGIAVVEPVATADWPENSAALRAARGVRPPYRAGLMIGATTLNSDGIRRGQCIGWAALRLEAIERSGTE